MSVVAARAWQQRNLQNKGAQPLPDRSMISNFITHVIKTKKVICDYFIDTFGPNFAGEL